MELVQTVKGPISDERISFVLREEMKNENVIVISFF